MGSEGQEHPRRDTDCIELRSSLSFQCWSCHNLVEALAGTTRSKLCCAEIKVEIRT
jgi:hypothetical protein